MARHTFGGGAADFVFVNASGVMDVDAAVPVQFYTALTGGTLITDLVDNTSTAINHVTTDSNGFLGDAFSGPDGVSKMAADANGGSGPRVWVYANDFDAQIAANATASAGAQSTGNANAIALTGAPMWVFINSDGSWPNRPSTTRHVVWVNNLASGGSQPPIGAPFALAGDPLIGP